MKAALPLLVLLGAFAALYGVGVMNLSVLDYDEAAYAEVARDMYVRGDLVEPRLGGEPFFEKPPWLYWGQVLGYRIFGVNELGARFFNATAAVLVLLVVFGFVRPVLGRRTALLSVLLLGTALAFFGVARIALTDMWLTLWLILALGCAHRGLEEGAPARWMYLAALAAGLAMLTKGAVGILLPGLAVLLYALVTRAHRRLFAPRVLVPSLLIAVGVGASWYLLLGATQPRGFGFMRELFVEHHVERFLEPAHSGHEGPLYTYLLVLFVGFQPWTFLCLASMRRAVWPEVGAGRRLLLLLAIFSGVTLVFFSIASTKLPNYITPLYPFLAVLTAVGLVHSMQGAAPDKPMRLAARITAGAPFALAGLCVAAWFLLPSLPDRIPEKVFRTAPGLAVPLDFGIWPLLVAVPSLLAGIWIVWRRHVSRPAAQVVPIVLGLLATIGLAFFTIVPRADHHLFRPLHHVARYAALRDPDGGPVAMVGIKYTPSTQFYGGRPSTYVSPRRTPQLEALFAGPGPRDVITTRPWFDTVRALGRTEILLHTNGYLLLRCHPRASSD